MAYPKFKDYLADILNRGELPGFEVQKQMAPTSRYENIKNYKPKDNYKQASVLALLIENSNTENSNTENSNLGYTSTSVLITERSANLNSHSGQLSFPGGRREPNETELEAALRETEEEIGLHRNHIEIIGQLSELYAPPSNSVIIPFVGFLNHDYEEEKFHSNLVLSQQEVEKAFFVDLDYLINPINLKKEIWNLMGKDIEVPFWDISTITSTKVPLWGATAIMLKELLAIYEDYKCRKLD